jgi:hypothetical protein
MRSPAARLPIATVTLVMVGPGVAVAIGRSIGVLGPLPKVATVTLRSAWRPTALGERQPIEGRGWRGFYHHRRLLGRILRLSTLAGLALPPRLTAIPAAPQRKPQFQRKS